MIFQPTNIIPSFYLGAGDGIIDASKTNIFSATINGRSPVVAYQCAIFKNNATSDLMYDSGVVELETPFFGADFNGNIVPFEYEVPPNDDTLEKYTLMENGYIYGYKHMLTLWWDLDKTDYSKNSVTSTEYVFYAKATPVVSILQFSDKLEGELPLVESRECAFDANYYQANNVGLSWFQWTLALASDRSNIVTQTKKIYTNSAIHFEYDGLMSDTDYSIKIELQNQDGVIVDSGWIDFAVRYKLIEIDSAIEIYQDKYGIVLDWGNLQYIEGVPNNSNWVFLKGIPHSNGTCVELMHGTHIDFTSSKHFDVEIPMDAVHICSFYIAEDTDEIYYADGTDDNGNPFYIRLSHYGSEPGLYPAESLYPSETLYPKDDIGGCFELDVNGETNYIAISGYVSRHWYIAHMSRNGIYIAEIPFVLDRSKIEVIVPDAN